MDLNVSFQGESRSDLMVQLHSIYRACYKWSSNRTPILYCLAVVVKQLPKSKFLDPTLPLPVAIFFFKIRLVYGSSCTSDCHKYLRLFGRRRHGTVRFDPTLFYLRKHLNAIWHTCQHLVCCTDFDTEGVGKVGCCVRILALRERYILAVKVTILTGKGWVIHMRYTLASPTVMSDIGKLPVIYIIGSVSPVGGWWFDPRPRQTKGVKIWGSVTLHSAQYKGARDRLAGSKLG